jgi:hypothetical protein
MRAHIENVDRSGNPDRNCTDTALTLSPLDTQTWNFLNYNSHFYSLVARYDRPVEWVDRAQIVECTAADLHAGFRGVENGPDNPSAANDRDPLLTKLSGTT